MRYVVRNVNVGVDIVLNSVESQFIHISTGIWYRLVIRLKIESLFHLYLIEISFCNCKNDIS